MAIIKTNARSASALDATILTGNLPAISGASLTNLDAGKVLQVVQTTKTDTFSTASSSYVDVTGMSVSITPTSTSNKILVNVSLCFLGDDSATMGYCIIVRDSTNIIRGNTEGSRVRATMQKCSNHVNEASVSNFMYLDSPSSTSALTYKVQLRNQGSGNVFVNRSKTWTNSAASSTNASSIIVTEIQG